MENLATARPDGRHQPRAGARALGRHWSYNLRNDPKRLPFVLARYKFAAALATRGRRVLELGCSEGIGCPLVAKDATKYTGVDFDEPAIDTARANWPNPKYDFVFADFLGQKFGTFDTVISLDVIEHIHVDYEDLFFQTVAQNLDEDGVCIIGTPNVTSAPYASEASQRGHINLYDADRLAAALGKVFHNVLRFGINDEVAHTGYAPMCHYLIQLGCYKRTAEARR
jgi:2-polyprenyl-3-methyl-5-hydroxy-6-metoxy-1,4-benzoquinol methylase